MANYLTFEYRKIEEGAKEPTRSKPQDAGIDFYALRKIRISGGTTALVQTGIRTAIPEGYFGFIRDRSGVAAKTTLFVKAGVIDSDYRGEIKIVMANHGDYPITIEAGEKIAQMVILPVPKVTIKENKDLGTDTTRGEDGFGSTGN